MYPVLDVILSILRDLLFDSFRTSVRWQVPHERVRKEIESLLVTCSGLHCKRQRRGLKCGLSHVKAQTLYQPLCNSVSKANVQCGGWAGEDVRAEQETALLTKFLTTSSLTWVFCYIIQE